MTRSIMLSMASRKPSHQTCTAHACRAEKSVPKPTGVKATKRRVLFNAGAVIA